MGICCNIKDLEKIWDVNNQYPVITTQRANIIKGHFKDFVHLSLGKVLSLALLKYEKTGRKNYVIGELDKIFYNSNLKKVIVDDIDMLFNPGYNIDILGYFIQSARNRKLIIIWPGKYVSDSLVYASSGYKDYKKYLIKNYNVICVK
ncbi:MAG: BREX-3 system P-loop-containing protein BrxF [Alkaliphilus sp.]|nr:BREX-3 system P-loop-containing protein BrxF [Alkaliphilus sp.]